MVLTDRRFSGSQGPKELVLGGLNPNQGAEEGMLANNEWWC